MILDDFELSPTLVSGGYEGGDSVFLISQSALKDDDANISNSNVYSSSKKNNNHAGSYTNLSDMSAVFSMDGTDS
jgi:hypothetical protein